MESPNESKDILVEDETKLEKVSLYDETRIPPEFIHPHAAEAADIHILKAGKFEMPVSFETTADGRFVITGVQSETGKGAIISGRVSDEEVKINHLDVDKELRDSGKVYKGVGEALLTDLELRLKSQGTKVVYASFFNAGTVKFLLKNGYEIIPIGSLSQETKIALKFNPKNFDTTTETREEFETRGEREGQILLRKQFEQISPNSFRETGKDQIIKDQEQLQDIRKDLGLE